MKIKNISYERIKARGHYFEPQEVKELDEQLAQEIMSAQPIRIKPEVDKIKEKKEEEKKKKSSTKKGSKKSKAKNKKTKKIVKK